MDWPIRQVTNIDLLREAFPSSEFSTREASAILGTSTATTRTLLNELRTKGLRIRAGRRRYRIAPDSNRATLDRRRMELHLEQALGADLELGLDSPDAVVNLADTLDIDRAVLRSLVEGLRPSAPSPRCGTR